MAQRSTVWRGAAFFSLSNLLLALLFGVLAGGSAAAVVLRRSPVYSSDATLIIDQPKALADAHDEGPLRKLALLRVKYAELVNTPAIAGPAAEQLGLPEAEVAGAVSATARPETLLLKLSAVSTTRSEARRVANAVAASIVAYVDGEQQRINVAPADRFRFTVVASASSTTRVRPTDKRAVEAGLALGAIVLLGAYVIRQLLTVDVRST